MKDINLAGRLGIKRPICVLLMTFISIVYAADAAPLETVKQGVSLTLIGEQAVEHYWTEEKMKKAMPFPSPQISGTAAKKLDQENSVPLTAQEAKVFGRPSRANVNKYPYKTGGKLFFTLKGRDYSCSAQFVGSSRVLMTAAHCVRATNGRWATNVIFKRAYANGGGQKFRAQCLATFNNWVTGGDSDWRWDYAFIKTHKASTTGWLGLTTQIPYKQFQAIGYPRNYGATKYMYKVAGKRGKITDGVVQMRGNPMREGSSGGAWLKGSYAIGLNSFYIRGNRTNMWGPYFDNNTLDLYHFAKNGCGQ